MLLRWPLKSASQDAADGTAVLLPGGKRSRLLDRATFERALIVADHRFEKAIGELRAQRRDGRGRGRAA